MRTRGPHPSVPLDLGVCGPPACVVPARPRVRRLASFIPPSLFIRHVRPCPWRCVALQAPSMIRFNNDNKGKGKGFPYSIPNVGPRTDPGVQAVSLQVSISHPPGGRLLLLSARPAVTSPAAEHHRPLASTKLY